MTSVSVSSVKIAPAPSVTLSYVKLSPSATDVSVSYVALSSDATVQLSASGMSRKFWTDYYTKAWAKPVFANADVIVANKKSIVNSAISDITKSKTISDDKKALDLQANNFIAALLKENTENIFAKNKLAESIRLKSQEPNEDEQLMLMAFVL